MSAQVMRCEESGDGIRLVLLHGIPTRSVLWRDLVSRLTDDRCSAWEMTG